MSEIQVFAHGLRFSHSSCLVIDRPYGLGCFVLLRFHSPMEVRTASGLVNAEPGHCILFSQGFPQWYRGREEHWGNDWMHIHAEGEAMDLLAERHGVSLNTLLAPCDTHFLPRIFEEIAHEQQHAEAAWEEAVELLVRQLLLLLGRALRDPAAHLTATEVEHLRALRALRWRVHEQLTRPWTISDMAAQAGLSSSRFAALYQQFFGVSPLEDLLRARVQHAQHLLTNRVMTVGEAATQSGFSSKHYFSHIFRKRVGCAPRDYHQRSNLWGNNGNLRRDSEGE